MNLLGRIGDAITKAGMSMSGAWGGGGVVGNTNVAIGSRGFVQALTPPGGAPPRRRGEDYLRSYATMPWLRAAVHKVSFACATVPWKLYIVANNPGDEPVEYTKPHPLRMLLTRGVRDPEGGQVLTGLQVRMVTQEYMELRGEAFWLLDRNVGGRGVPVQAWPCPPNWIVRTPTQDDPTFWLTMPHGMQAKVPPSEVVWFRDPDPYNPYTRGVGIAESLGEELSTDEFASKYVNRFFWNSARPDLIVSNTGLNEPGQRRLEEEWNRRNQGVWNAFRTYFLSGAADVKVIDRKFTDLQFTELRKWERDVIFQTFGIPPEIMGNLQNSNRATIEVADYIFAKWVVAPRLAMFDAAINGRLIPEYDNRLLLEHDDPVPENREAAIKEVLDVNAGQVFTQNERRKKLGLDEVVGGDMFLVPVTLTASGSLGSQAEPGEVTPDAVTEPEPTLEDVPVEGPEVPVGRSFTPRVKDAPDDFDAIDLDSVLSGAIEEAKKMAGQLQPTYRYVVDDHGTRALAEVGAAAAFNLVNERVITYLQHTAPKRIRGITDTTWKQLREQLAEGIAAGETIPQLSDRVSAVFADAKGARATLIARTETIDASNFGAVEGYRQSGVVQQKEWLTARDEKVCPICEPLDGEIVDLDQPFSSGDDEPGAHPDCRCSVAPVIEGVGAGDLAEAAAFSHSLYKTEQARTAAWHAVNAHFTAGERMFLRELKKALQEQQGRILTRLRSYKSATPVTKAKSSKVEAEYVDNAHGKQLCRDCTMFRAPNGCTAVAGTISPAGHCKFFKAKKALVGV